MLDSKLVRDIKQLNAAELKESEKHTLNLLSQATKPVTVFYLKHVLNFIREQQKDHKRANSFTD